KREPESSGEERGRGTSMINMGISRSPPRNWKGIGISMLVVGLLASVIIVAILMLTPGESSRRHWASACLQTGAWLPSPINNNPPHLIHLLSLFLSLLLLQSRLVNFLALWKKQGIKPGIKPPSRAERITSSGQQGVIFNGISDWLYEEEILKASSAHWCSPDGAWLAYLTINNSLVPKMELPQFLGGKYPASRHYPYPKAGQLIPSVQLFVVNLSEAAPHGLEIHPPELFQGREYYITMVKWVALARLAVRWLNRPQNMSVWSLCEAATGACPFPYVSQQGVPVFSEDAETLFLTVPVKQGAQGEFHHITMLSTQLSTMRLLTSGSWDVTRILAYDEKRKRYFLSSEDRPSARHLYSVDLDGSFNRSCVTCGLRPGCSFVDASFSPQMEYFTLFCKGPGIPQVSVHSTANPHGAKKERKKERKKASKQASKLHSWEYHFDCGFRCKLACGWPALQRPPLLFFFSPEAPGDQMATEEFHLGWDTVLASSLGAVVVRFDGWGPGNQGLKLLHKVNHRLGYLDVMNHIVLLDAAPSDRPAPTLRSLVAKSGERWLVGNRQSCPDSLDTQLMAALFSGKWIRRGIKDAVLGEMGHMNEPWAC
uniref:Dipeptidylpeptidase IV N-terminal domain-containing protein n=1 Tax=Varanus komodoensis TaxID=61221 RepID=A0A8D2J0F6_VARKO